MSLPDTSALLAAMLASSPIGIAIATPDSRLLQVNPALCALLGAPESALLGTRLIEHVHPDDVASFHAAVARLFQVESAPCDVAIRLRPQDRPIVWAQVTGVTAPAMEPMPLRLILHVQPLARGAVAADDPLAPLDQSQALSRREAMATRDHDAAFAQRLGFLLDHVPVVIYSLAPDPALTRLYFSPQHEVLTGYTLAEALANTGDWLEMVHPDDYPRVAAESARAAAATDRFSAEYRLRRKDGQYVWIHDECVPARDASGQLIAWQGVLLDITDQVRAQAAQAHLASLVMSADDAIISSDLSGAITSWNQGATRLYGHEADAMVGQPFWQLLPPDTDVAALIAHIRAARSGATVASFEAQRQRQDGGHVDVAITMSPIRDANGVVTGISTIARDITARLRLEQALRDAVAAAEAALRAKSHFLAMMSHELRTPVQAILGYADLLLLESAGALAPEQRADLLSIRDGASRLDRLISQLLDLSRMETGSLALTREPVALAPIIDDLREAVLPQAMARGLAVEIAVPAALTPAYADPARVRQVLLSLVENAVKFTERGTVSIRAREAAGLVLVEVSDTGIGIDAADLPTIFDAFHQVDSSLTRRYQGAGLGLALAQQLAMHMGGHISVSSTPGHGSTFRLELPAAPAHATSAAPS